MTATDTAASLRLDSTMVGRIVASRHVAVDFHASAVYAGAIGAERSVYLDDRTPGGAMAPPSFITSLEWPLVSGPDFLAAIGIAPRDLFPRLLHMFQDSTFSAPIGVGDRLSLEATLESVSQLRTGALATARIRTVNEGSGTLVAESWFGSYFRDTDVPRPRTSRTPPAIAVATLAEPIDRDVISISRGASHVYSECARLMNPIHTDLSFATALGLPDIALHGTLLWARMGEIAIDRYAGGHPENLRRLAMRFKRPLLPNRSMVIETCSADDAAQASLQLHDRDSGDVLRRWPGAIRPRIVSATAAIQPEMLHGNNDPLN